MITFYIDELTPCLKNLETGELVETEILKLKRKSFLSKYNSKTGWYVNWGDFSDEIEVYALVIRGTVNIQGLIALSNDESAKAIKINWACTAPENNKWQYGKQKYSGVGGHLLALASELSMNRGYEGYIYATAMDEGLRTYYINEFDGLPLPALGNEVFRFMLPGDSTKKLREVYDYEWSDEVL